VKGTGLPALLKLRIQLKASPFKGGCEKSGKVYKLQVYHYTMTALEGQPRKNKTTTLYIPNALQCVNHITLSPVRGGGNKAGGPAQG
jgi:hypothetical protein